MSTLRIALTALATFGLALNTHALGLELGQTKEELKLDYTVSVSRHKTERVTVVFTLKDEGRMKPLYSIDLSIPSQDGSGHFHLVTSLKLSGEGKAKTARIHIHKDWLKNANISLKTGTLDGKATPGHGITTSFPLTEWESTTSPRLPSPTNPRLAA